MDVLRKLRILMLALLPGSRTTQNEAQRKTLARGSESLGHEQDSAASESHAHLGQHNLDQARVAELLQGKQRETR